MISKLTKVNIKVYWLGIVCFLAILLLMRERDEITQISSTMLQLNFFWLFLAFIVSTIIVVIFGLLIALTNGFLYKKTSLFIGGIYYFERIFIAAVSPLSGPTGTAFLAQKFKNKYHVPRKFTLYSSLVNSFYNYTTYILLLMVTLFIYKDRVLNVPIEGVFFSLVFIFLALFGVIYLMTNYSKDSPLKYIPKFMHHILDESEGFKLSFTQHLVLFTYAAVVETLGVVLFYLVLLTLNIKVTLFMVLLGYLFTMLFILAVPIFYGMGAVELGMISFLVLFGFSKSDAISISLVYRLLQFWYPVTLGFVLSFFDYPKKTVA